MKKEKLYIFAGRAIEAIEAARRRNLRSSDVVYISHADLLRGVDRRPRVIRCGTWRERPDADLINRALAERGAVIVDAP